MTSPSRQRAALFAEVAHQGKLYDERTPYRYHLQAVVNVMERFGVEDEAIICAGYCHDTMEDTGVSFNDVRKEVGDDSAELVYLCTNEKGRNRKEKMERTYPAIKANPRALIVKLCDRIANLEHGYARGGKTAMYKAEYGEFKALLYSAPDAQTKEGRILANLWAHLDQLMK